MATRFPDVPQTHWAHGYIDAAAALGLIKGYPDGTFRPDAACSRAEAAVIAVRVLADSAIITALMFGGFYYLSKVKK